MHITDIRKYQKCHKLYEYSLADSQRPAHFSFYNVNIDTTESIARKLAIKEYAIGQVGQTIEDTLMLSLDYSWIFRARVEYKDLRLRIPLLHFTGEGTCEIYSILLSTSVSNDEYTNLFYYYKALKLSGIEVEKMSILHLNKNYVRQQQLDDDLLWSLETAKNSEQSIVTYVKNFEIDLDGLLEEINQFQHTDEIIHTNKCTGRNRCLYYEKCFPNEDRLPDNSILTLVSSGHKYEMFNEGILFLKDADIDRVEGNKVQYSQIKADQNGGQYIDKPILNEWLSKSISYPISFIDFEWDLFPIPPYAGMKPLDVLLFQYSLHVYDGKELKHYQFIGEKDCRKQLALSILENIPASGTVFAYNAKGAEKIRISELARTFPELAQPLLEINNRMIDMADPFISGMVYDTRFRGNFTLKVLEEVIDDQHSYHDLDVGNGMEAVMIHRKLEETDDQQQKQQYLDELYQYCGLDTYSLYKVMNWLIDISK